MRKQLIIIIVNALCIVAPKLYNDPDCGGGKSFADPTTYIVNGTEVALYPAYPFMVLFFGHVRVIGAGSLLNSQWVITAAQVILLEENPFVILGVHDVPEKITSKKSPEGSNFTYPLLGYGGIERTVKMYLLYPYAGKGALNDIALVQLSEKVKFGAFIIPICLPNRSFIIVGRKMFSAGYGAIVKHDEIVFPKSLQHHTVYTHRCSQSEFSMFKETHVYDPVKICARGKTSGACGGDNGNPLFKRAKTGSSSPEWTIYGVFSEFSMCDGANQNLYVRLNPYLSWIREIIFAEDLHEFPHQCGQSVALLQVEIIEDGVGMETDTLTMPFIVSVASFTRTWCSGALISNAWVLSTSYCIDHILGVTYPNILIRPPEDDPIRLIAANVYHHPTYKPSDRDLGICLLNLRSKLELEPWLQPVCLPMKDYDIKIGDEVLFGQWNDDKKKIMVFKGDVADCELSLIMQDIFCTKFRFPKGFKVEFGDPVFKRIKNGYHDSWTLFGFINELRFQNYSDFFYISTSVPYITDWIETYSTGKPHDHCGMTESRNYNMILDEEAKVVPYDSYPFMAILISEVNGQVTQGALLNAQCVISVAHFFLDAPKNRVTVYIGLSGLQNDTGAHQRKILSLQINHQHYFSPEYDLAIIQLDEPIPLSESIQPICLPPGYLMNWLPNYYHGEGRVLADSLRLVGWGLEKGMFAEYLNELYVSRINQQNCSGSSYTNSMCFGQNNKSSGSFVGGSGALLFYRFQQSEDYPIQGWTLMGLMSSLHLTETQFEFPLVSPNVILNIEWILEILYLYDLPGKDNVCGRTFHGYSHEPIGGQVQRGTFPFVTAVRKDSRIICDGTIIHKYWILTNAHCLSDVNKDALPTMDVILGAYDLRDLDDEGSFRYVKDIVTHPDYEDKSRSKDIALIQLDRAITFTDIIQPACLPLPFSSPLYGEEQYQAGWKFVNGNLSSSFMQHTFVRLHGCDNCPESVDAEVKTCLGNNDGHVYEYNVKKWYPSLITWTVTGVLSQDSTGCSIEDPPVRVKITRLAVFVTWIKEVISPHEKDQCGMDFISTDTPYIYDGHEAVSGQFPFAAFVKKADNTYCSGTIIHHDWIITTAICVSGLVVEDVEVILGRNDLSYNTTAADFRTVSGIYIHPEYYNFYFHDIALLKMETAIQFTKKIQPICLPAENFKLPVGDTVTVVGWGYSKEEQTTAPHLNNVEMTVMDWAACHMKLQLSSENICLWDPKTGRHPCQGDFGGPAAKKLEINNTKSWTLIGVINDIRDNKICDFSNKPYPVADVSKVLKWLKEVMEPINPFPGTCGHTIFNKEVPVSYISSGTVTKKGRYPFMAIIVSRTGDRCGGALIHHQWIISAAYCLRTISLMHGTYSDFTARVGVFMITSWEEEYQERSITEIHTHEDDMHYEIDFRKRISLLKLATPILYSAWVQPICLEKQDLESLRPPSFTVLGWMRESRNKTVLLDSKMAKVPLTECKIREYKLRQPPIFCLKVSPPHTGHLCEGDYGGPIIREVIFQEKPFEYGWVLTGVALYGTEHCVETADGVVLAAEVRAYSNWIQEKTSAVPIFYCGKISRIFKKPEEMHFLHARKVARNSFPFLALIEDSNSYVGGTIISEHWIITLANFFISAERKNTIVRLGIHNFKRIEKGSSWNYVRSVHKNPEPERDILAMVRLANPITFTETIQPICLPVNTMNLTSLPSMYMHIAVWNVSMNYDAKDEIALSRKVVFERVLLAEECLNITNQMPSFGCNIFYLYHDPEVNVSKYATPGTDYDPLCQFNGKVFFSEVNISSDPIVYGWTLYGLMEGSAELCLSTEPMRQVHKITYHLDWILRVMYENLAFEERCGMSYVEEIVTDYSKISVPGRTPFMVSIQTGTNIFCGGALLEDGWVITAPTCVLEAPTHELQNHYGSVPANNITVTFGVFDRDVNTRYVEDVRRENVYIPMEFWSAGYNIALIKTNTIPLNKIIQPICLPLDVDVELSHPNLLLAGWGNIDNATSPKIMMVQVKRSEIYLPGVDGEFIISAVPVMNETVFMSPNCIVEAGSPIFVKAPPASNPVDMRWLLIGLTYHGLHFCKRENMYLSTNILDQKYHKWMRAIMIKQSVPKGDCGIPLIDVEKGSSSGKLLFGGVESTPGTWPWMALLYVFRVRCAGSVISHKLVLTVATCVSDMPRDDIIVEVRLKVVTSLSDRTLIGGVEKVIIHPRFRYPAYEFNIAVIVLPESLTFGPYLQPICLPELTFNAMYEEGAYMVGVGKIPEDVRRYEVLRHMKVQLMNWRICQFKTKSSFTLPLRTVCAEQGKSDVCERDEGGPLNLKISLNSTHNSWLLYGILTRPTPGCKKQPIPVVAIQVSAFHIWIHEQLDIYT